MEKVNNIIEKWDKEFNPKTWNIVGTIKIKKIFSISDKYKRQKEYIYNIEDKDNIIFTGSKDAAIKEFQEKNVGKTR
jgi:hypothetical protein